MRRLHLKRERALFCFGVPYFCVPGYTKELLKETADKIGYPDILHVDRLTGISMNNGDRVVFDLPDEACSFVIAVFRESCALLSDTVEIPAGTEDLYYTIITDYDGGNRVKIHVDPSEAAK